MESDSELKYPGPYCEEILLTKQDLKTCTINKPSGPLKNGTVLEISGYLDKIGHSSNHLLNIVTQLNPTFQVSSAKYLKNKVSRLTEQRKKLASKKKVPGFKNVSDLLNAEFRSSMSLQCANQSTAATNQEPTATTLQETIVQIANIHVTSKEDTCTQGNSVSTQTECDPKVNNLDKYNAIKLEKFSDKLEKKILDQKSELNELANRIGHYSTRNINKRDETAKKNLHALRDSQRANLRQERQLNEGTRKLQDAETEINLLRQQSAELHNEVLVLREKVDTERNKKINVQKVNSYIRKEHSALKAKLKGCSDKNENNMEAKCATCSESQTVIQEKKAEIDELKESLEGAKKYATKKEDGTYLDNVRLCIIELAGLEIASEKISPAIQAVSNHIFSHQFDKKDLPNKTSVQSIIDEGHYLGKAYISSRLDSTTSWGLNRDGTTRKKKKIVDTSVTLDNGEIIGLGFTRVAHENAKTIHEVTKTKLEELADLQEESKELKELPLNEDFVVDSLRKLAFTMSDRASNEKLADKLLDEWRDDLLGQYEGHTGEQHEKLHHFHCMAHVLLGFHNYACSDIKAVTETIEKDNSPLGRNAHPAFKFWGKRETVVERAAKTISDTFGPAGEHYGLRDRWEATCAEEGIKSLIGNYRDNRFNCIFQTAAEILVHIDKFLQVIETVKKPNRKIISVQCDLKDDRVIALLQYFGLIYVKVTGPYWNLVTSGEVPYLLLHTHIQELADFLAQCSKDPSTLLHPDGHWKREENMEFAELPHRKRLVDVLFAVNKDTEDILRQAIQCVTAAMLRTVEKQLSDFLPGGKYAEMPAAKDLKNTRYAHSTNLGCEHHFGDLDSSQKKRPNASMHHHTTVQLLKRNRKPLMSWVQEMSPNEREELMKKARKGSKILRVNNLSAEKEVVKEITEDMLKEKAPAKKRRKTNAKRSEVPVFEDSEEENDFAELNLPIIEQFTENEYIVVAYQDGWYPGVVLETEGKSATVKFMSPCRKQGHFMWPQREDKQNVSSEFVLKRGLIPECLNSGRQWFIKEVHEIDNLFELYEKKFF